MSKGRWSGRKVSDARAHWGAIIRQHGGVYPCGRCGRPITLDMKWHVGHIVDRALGGSDDLTNTRPEHAHENMADGGRKGAAITNGRKPVVVARLESERARGIRGI